MLAAVLKGPQDLLLQDIEQPRPGSGEVLIEVGYTGICGTDLHEFLRPTFSNPPVVLGHETSGTIVELGAGVASHKVGERVTVIPMDFCGECYYCHRAMYHLCEKPGWVGFTRGGAFARYMAVPARLAVRLPDNVPLEVGALTEHFTVAFHAMHRADLRIGERVLVLGAGPVGLAVVQCASASGAGSIVAVEPSALRAQRAKDLGATHVVDPASADSLKALTQGVGFDVVFDAAGTEGALQMGFNHLRKGGRYMSMCPWEKSPAIDMNKALLSEHDVRFVFGYDMFNDFRGVLDLVSRGVLDAGRQITARIPLKNILVDGFLPLVESRDKQIKVMVDLAQ